MLRHWSLDASHPNPALHLCGDLQNTARGWLPGAHRQAEDLPRVNRYFMHVPLLTYLIYLSSKEIY